MKNLVIQTDCPTRWSSLCTMMQRMLHARLPLAATLAKLQNSGDVDTPSNLDNSQWELLEQLLVVLRPIKGVSTYLQTQEVPTVGVVLPVIQALTRKHLDTTVAFGKRKCNASTKTPTVIERFKITIGDHIEKRFSERSIKWKRELLLSVLLDPRAKDFYFITEPHKRTRKLDRAKKIARKLLKTIEDVDLLKFEATQPQVSSDESMISFLEDLIGPSSVVTTTPKAIQELENYMLLPRISLTSKIDPCNPLDWWRLNETTYPNMANLAKKYLVMMTSNASVERVFSQAGWIVDKRRASLTDASVETRLLIVANKEYIS